MLTQRSRVWTGLVVVAAAVGACSASPGAPSKVDAGTPGGVPPDGGAPPVLTQASLAALRALSPVVLPAPPADLSNQYGDDGAAAELGQRLFFDPGFSGPLLDDDNIGDSHSLGQVGDTGKVACAGCHLPTKGFIDTRSSRQNVSLGSGWGKRKAPSLLDVGQARVLMWDGRHDALYNQPFGALENGVEMNSSRLYAAQQVYKRYRASYEAVFGAMTVPLDDATRFPQLGPHETGCRSLSTTIDGVSTGIDCHGTPGDNAEFDSIATQEDRDAVTRVWVNVGKAIGAYERLLTCGPSRFDDWMHGESSALTPDEQRGAALFVGQREDGTTVKGCDSCHSGPFFTDQGFHNVGMRPTGTGPAGSFIDRDDHGFMDGLTQTLTDPLNVKGQFSDGDDGRLPTTPPANAAGAFRTPSLRCVGLRPTFLHTGQIRSMYDIVAFFSRGGDGDGYPGTNELAALELTAQESSDLIAFLQSLTGPGPAARLLQAPPLP